MKKIVYTILFALILSSSFISCTEESVTPAETTNNGGGSPADPKGN